MYVRTLRLKNIRPFKELEFSFERPGVDPEAPLKERYSGWNVIAGDNASGKSTLARALVLALVGPDLAHTLVPDFAGWIRKGADAGQIAVELVSGEEDRFKGGGNRIKEPFWAELSLIRRGEATELEAKPRTIKAHQNGPWAIGQGAWFSAAYGPFRRLFGSSPEAARLMAVPGKAPRYATLFREDATLAEATEWVKNLKFKTLEQQKPEKEVLDEVLRFLNDDFLRRGFQVDEVNSNGLWLTGAGGVRLALAEMSDGYRSSLALLMDLLRHMVAVYGSGGLLKTDADTGMLFVPHAGVVIIDEVDSHLHPEWQRLIGAWLKRRFPAVQFITTSHSPFVVQATDPGGLYVLPSPDDARPPMRVPEPERLKSVIGTADEVLRGAPFEMEHTRSPVVVEKRREYSRLKAVEAARPLSSEERSRQQALLPFIRSEFQD